MGCDHNAYNKTVSIQATQNHLSYHTITRKTKDRERQKKKMCLVITETLLAINYRHLQYVPVQQQ